MIIAYMFASLLGAMATVAVLWPNGWLLAILCAPLGSSGLTLVVTVGVALARMGKEAPAPTDALTVHF